MIQIKNPANCCGCTACASICRQKAIAMQPDPLGFLYPHVDEEKCTNCGLCEKVCAFHSDYETNQNFENPICYGARHKNTSEVETSRSGATFIALSDYILGIGGVVYGAGYGEHFRVIHKRATSKEERNDFKGSKYVQSEMGDIFSQVQNDLKQDRYVLFSGTPCQIAGLKSFINPKLRNKLYLQDIICHGVPSPTIWKDYLNHIESLEGDRIVQFSFRDKRKKGWSAHEETFFFKDHEVTSQLFTKAFYQHIMFRHCCGVCPYTNLRRPGDITLADFWGWEKTDEKLNTDDKGVSLVLCNTPKGHDLFQKISQDMIVVEAKIGNCMQPNMQHPSIIHPKRMNFEKDYIRKGFKYVFSDLDRYDRVPLLHRFVSNAKHNLRKILR